MVFDVLYCCMFDVVVFDVLCDVLLLLFGWCVMLEKCWMVW